MKGYYTSLFENSHAAMLIIDPSNGEILDANKAAADLYGWSIDQLKNMNISQINQLPIDIILSKMAQTLECTQKQYNFKHLTADGTIKDVNVYSGPITIEGKKLLYSTIYDMTETQKARMEFEESEQKFKQIYEHTAIGLARVSLDFTIINANRAYCEMLGYTEKELIGKHLKDITQPEVVAKNLQLQSQLASGIIDHYHMEKKFIHKTGRIIYGILDACLIRDSKNRPSYFLGSVVDITDRCSLEEQLRQAHKLESIGRLAGGVAHDFNNMLSVIIGHTEMALSDISEDNPMAEYLNAIMQAAERSSDITRQLLAFARKQTINPKILDINVCIEKMLSMLQNLIGENIDLSWCPQQEIWPVKMDSAQVDQLLTNLCLNARDAVLDIGKITIETAAVSFDTDYCKDHAGFIPGDYVMLAVTDTGQGIDKKILPYLFEPFFTTKQLGRGTGLGLATVYGIVKQNKGFINVYSEPGKGTIFKIYLSRHYTNAPVNEQVISIKAAAKGKGQKILVLEDENTMLKIITRMVKSLGYSPISADRPNRAIEIARSYRQKESPESKIDLLITDVVMPEMNGRDLANQIKSIFPDIKIIFMSGYTENVIAHQGILDENINFIQKPFNTSCLARTIEDVLFNK